MVILELAESVPVTVNSYVPEVVPGFVADEPLLPPPHPVTRTATPRQAMTIIAAKRLRRAGIPHRKMTARAMLPPLPHRFLRNGSAREALDGAVVVSVRSEVALPPAFKVTLVGVALHAGSPTAPAGDVLSAQVRFIVPE